MTRELKKNLHPAQPWQVDDEDALKCLPNKGFLHDLVDYMQECTDAPIWCSYGSALTCLASACGNMDIKILREDGQYKVHGTQLWSVIIAHSGSRKSASMDIATRILRDASPKMILPGDGSPEGLHNALCDDSRNGVGLFHRDEMSRLFDQVSKSYSKGLIGWLLETYRGEPMSRALTAKKELLRQPNNNDDDDEQADSDNSKQAYIDYVIERPRVSILGGIPPSVLQQKTDRTYWRSGFLARFLFWAARRVAYMEIDTQNVQIENKFSAWLRNVPIHSNAYITIPYGVAKPVLKWIRKNIEEKSHRIPDDIFSTLNRLQIKAFQIAGLIAVSKRERKPDKTVLVCEEDIDCAILVMEKMYNTFFSLFKEVAGTLEGTQQELLYKYIREHSNCTAGDLQEAFSDISPRTVQRLLHSMVLENQLVRKRPPKGIMQSGRPGYIYIPT